MDATCCWEIRLTIREISVTHIKEDWGESFDEHAGPEDKHPGVSFAYDGMVVEI